MVAFVPAAVSVLAQSLRSSAATASTCLSSRPFGRGGTCPPLGLRAGAPLAPPPQRLTTMASSRIVPTPPPASAALASSAHGRAREVLTFWFGTDAPLPPYATRPDQMTSLWFPSGDAAAAADAAIVDRFSGDVEAALAGDGSYMDLAYGRDATPWSALALVVLLDQFPRALYRGTARAFAGDAAALAASRHMLDGGEPGGPPPLVEGLPWIARMFAVMPHMHAEDAPTVRRCVEVFEAMAKELSDGHGEEAVGVAKAMAGSAKFGESHLAIVDRFGRYPYRNGVLGRETTPEEKAWIEKGGDSFGQ